jgi:hypothetical protein
MKKTLKDITFMVVPLISIGFTALLLIKSIKAIYFSGYCTLLNNRTIIKYFPTCSQGVNDSADNLYFNLETKIIFLFYLFCLVNLYFYKRKFRNSKNK